MFFMAIYEVKGNVNYAAEAFTVSNTVDLEGLDRLVGVPWRGFLALVPKGTVKAGEVVVAFPAGSQISDIIARGNNLYRNAILNSDPEQTGYLENNRRVKAIRLRGYVSSALVLPAEAFGNPEPGTVFDTWNKIEVCRKYVSPQERSKAIIAPVSKKELVDAMMFPEHVSTEMYLRNQDKIGVHDVLYISQKLHGCSARFGRLKVDLPDSRWLRVLKTLRLIPRDYHKTELRTVAGSRRVIKSGGEEKKVENHFYDSDIWTEVAQSYEDRIPEGVIVYGEIVGWVGDKPIQKDYTYNLPVGEWAFYVYRVNVGGKYDLSDAGMRAFCRDRDIPVVPLLLVNEGPLYDDQIESFMDQNFYNTYIRTQGAAYLQQPVPLCNESPVDEGVVIRIENVIPSFYKLKGPRFYEHESVMLDKNVVDVEEEN